MGLQPTASRTDLLLQCQRPFDPATEIQPEEQGPEATAGQSDHKKLHLAIFKPLKLDAPWPPHINRALKALKSWISEHGYEPVSGEQHRALHVGTKLEGCISRDVEFDEATHHYSLHSGMPIGYEIGYTADLELADKQDSGSCVLDYKTGAKWDWKGMDPKTGQNLTIALAGKHSTVAILHSPENGIPVVHWEPVSKGELDLHRAKLRLALSRIGDGSMRMGPECKFCPARHDCPTQVGNLLIRVEAIVRKLLGKLDPVEVEDVGTLYTLINPAKALLERSRTVISERVAQGEVFETDKGKTLEIVEVEREVMATKHLDDNQRKILRSWKALVKRKWTELRAK